MNTDVASATNAPARPYMGVTTADAAPRHHVHRHTKACAHCATPFEAQRSTAKFCSATCRKRASRGAVTLRTGHPPRHAKKSLSESLRSPEGQSSAPSDPQFVQSDWTGRVYPRTYAEHGLPFPDHLRAKRAA